MHYEELHGLYAYPNTIRVLKNKKIKWAGGEGACYVCERSTQAISVEKPEEKKKKMENLA
jgi:hypothetical protein